MTKPRRVIAVLNLPKHVPDVIKLGQTVVQAMTSNLTTFPSPNPALNTVSNHIAALDAAETVAQSKTKGAAEARDVKLSAVVADLQYLKSYVQQAADANPASAEAIIQSAGLSVRKPTIRQKPDFEARQGEHSGQVQLIAKGAGARAAYVWQLSTDQKAWTALPTTVLARTTIQNLTPATLYYFRYRVVTSAGEAEWGQTVSLLVT